MRRTIVICASLVALALPAGALALRTGPGDGTLVVKNGSAPRGIPVVTLVLSQGAAIGQIDSGHIVVKDLVVNDPYAPEVTGFSWRKSNADDDTETTYGGVGANFRFRAVGGPYKLTIYGSGVDLIASGSGTAVLAGSPDPGSSDGSYSLNGGEFTSLPGTPTKLLHFGQAPTG